MLLAPLFSGSSGNCILAEAASTRLLIDAGKPCRTALAALDSIGIPPESISGILITHEHMDHVAGLGPLCRRLGIPIYANAATWQAMEPGLGSIPPRCVRVFETGREFYIGGAAVTPFPIPHDAAEPVGYSIRGGGRRLTVMTDMGYAAPEPLACAAGSDLLLIEANHDPELVKSCSYPYVTKRRILSDHGHLSNEACGRALAGLYLTGVRRAVLGHLSRDNNFESLALETVRAELRAQDIPDGEFDLAVAHRDRPSGLCAIEEE